MSSNRRAAFIRCLIPGSLSLALSQEDLATKGARVRLRSSRELGLWNVESGAKLKPVKTGGMDLSKPPGNGGCKFRELSMIELSGVARRGRFGDVGGSYRPSRSMRCMLCECGVFEREGSEFRLRFRVCFDDMESAAFVHVGVVEANGSNLWGIKYFGLFCGAVRRRLPFVGF